MSGSLLVHTQTSLVHLFTSHLRLFILPCKGSLIGRMMGKQLPFLPIFEAMLCIRNHTDVLLVQIRNPRRGRRVHQHRLPQHAMGRQPNLYRPAFCSHAFSCSGRIL